MVTCALFPPFVLETPPALFDDADVELPEVFAVDPDEEAADADAT